MFRVYKYTLASYKSKATSATPAMRMYRDRPVKGRPVKLAEFETVEEAREFMQRPKYVYSRVFLKYPRYWKPCN